MVVQSAVCSPGRCVVLGDAFLLEHNTGTGKDDYWSDNWDGSGGNNLGLDLMELRAQICPGSTPVDHQHFASHVSYYADEMRDIERSGFMVVRQSTVLA